MQAGRSAALRQPCDVRLRHDARWRLGHAVLPCGNRHLAVKGFGIRAFGKAGPATGQKDMTAELLERAFGLALMSRLKQYAGIHVDVRSTAWGLMEGKFGGMTVRGNKWRTPLELTAEQLCVDVGELILDYQKLVWQQIVALKNVPQGSVAFTLSSQDLGNFMVHPIMVAAAARAVKGQAFTFDRSTASVRLDPTTGRGVITYQGIWAGDGNRYAVTMSTPPPAASATTAAITASAGGVASVVVSSNTLEQLTVSARRVVPATAAARSTTGSFASVGSTDEEPLAAAEAAMTAAAAPTAAVTAIAAAAAALGSESSGRVRMLTVAREVPAVSSASSSSSYGASVAAGAGAAVLSAASVGSMDDAEADAGAEVVAEGLRRFFSSLVINLQGIELRKPVLLVQRHGPGVGATAAAATATAKSPPRPTFRPASASAIGSSPGAGLAAAATAAAAGPASPGGAADLAPALLTITMKVAILQLPPLNMKF